MRIALPHDQAGFLATIAEFHNAVMAQRQPVREIADCGHGSFGRARYLEQELMLLWCEPRSGCSLFAEVQKPSESKAELGE